MGNINLIVMKKSRKKPKDGDVFVVQPSEGLYFFGKVIKAVIDNGDDFFKSSSLIYIYNFRSESKIPPYNLDNFELLIPPCFLSNFCWNDGLIETVANMEVTEKDRKVSYGFYKQKKYIDMYYNIIEDAPEYINSFTFSTQLYLSNAMQIMLKLQEKYGLDYVAKHKRDLYNHKEFIPVYEDNQPNSPNQNEITEKITTKLTLKVIKNKKNFLKEWKKALKEEGDSLGFTIEDVDKCASVLDEYIDKLQSYNGKATNEEIMECVKEVVLSLNELNKKTDENLIETMEREELYEFIQQAAKLAGLETDETDITEEWREW
jgi:hypothetical protein